MHFKVIFLCLVLLLVPVSAQFGWLWDWLGFSDDDDKVITKHDEIHMTAPELITSKGYPCEIHTVTTIDGYILELHRIPYGRKTKTTSKNRPVALLQHGVVGSSTAWLLNPADESLPFILADAGVDVWLGNNRGNTYSKKHTTLDPDTYEFWDFSWDEMAQFDLPAEIDYILDKTDQEQLYYVGYSQGTAIGFAKFSDDQKLSKKIKHFIALAPVAHIEHITSGLRYLVPIASEIKTLLNLFGGGEINPSPDIMKTLTSFVCSGLGEDLCMGGMSFFMGNTHGHSINKSRIDLYNAQTPSSTSVKVLMQWVQAIKSKKFQHFDHGAKENFVRYGQSTPPLYNPKNIEVPVAIFTGGNDALADPTDVSWLLTQINVTHHVNVHWYNHLALTLAYDAKDLIFPQVTSIITDQSSSPKDNSKTNSNSQGSNIKIQDPKMKKSNLKPPPMNRAGLSRPGPRILSS